ncbi:hypothetical protein [Pseudomonas lini]
MPWALFVMGFPELLEATEKSQFLAKKLDEATESAARERAEASAAVTKLEQVFTQAEGASVGV